MLAYPQKHTLSLTYTQEEKSQAGWRACPLSLSRNPLIVCPFSWALNASKPPSTIQDHRIHYNMRGAKKKNFITRVKTIPLLFWSHRFRGYWKPGNFSTLALRICLPVTVQRATRLHNALAGWPSLNYLTAGHIILHVVYWLDSISLNLIFARCVWDRSANVVTVNGSGFSIDLGPL